MTRHTEITPPIGDGTWWLVQCHTCRTLWPAVDTRRKAEQLRDRHEAEHAAEATVGNHRAQALAKALGGAA